MNLLKLAALDEDDLSVISAHLQDAVVRIGDIRYLPGEQRFVLVANRFDWQGAGGKNLYEIEPTENLVASAERFGFVLIDADTRRLELRGISAGGRTGMPSCFSFRSTSRASAST